MAKSIPTYILACLDERPDDLVMAGGKESIRSEWRAGELAESVRRLAAGLAGLGLKPGERIGIVADNHDHWLLADLAALAAGLTDVPRGADCSAEEAAFVLEHSDARACFVQNAKLLERIWPELEKVGCLETIILMRPGEIEVDLGSRRLVPLDDLLGEEEFVHEGSEEDLATIVYTSGTTGNPKGVRLLHGNILHNMRVLPAQVGLRASDRYLSFLPTWHAFERTLEYCLLTVGASLHYSDKARLRRDMPQVKPTIIAGVPRLWESLAGSVMSKIAKSSNPRRLLAQSLLGLSRIHTDAHRRLEALTMDDDGKLLRSRGLGILGDGLKRALTAPFHGLAGKLVYGKLGTAMGGEVRLLISGGGALPAHVDEFMTRAGLPFLNGYGLTETAPVVCLRDPLRNVLTTAGRRLAETSWRVMDLDGEAELPQGEKGVLWVQGPQVMDGYHENDEATAQVLQDGWFCTGDLAILSDEDDLLICGRAKDTIVLRGGENVEPELVEAAITELPWIRDLILVGHGEKHLGALVIPEPEQLVLRFPDLAEDDVAAAAHRQDVASFLHQEIASVLSPGKGWRIYEKVPRIAMLPQAFDPEDGTMTRTMKKRRPIIEEKYADLIGSLFQEGAPEARIAGSEG